MLKSSTKKYIPMSREWNRASHLFHLLKRMQSSDGIRAILSFVDGDLPSWKETPKENYDERIIPTMSLPNSLAELKRLSASMRDSQISVSHGMVTHSLSMKSTCIICRKAAGDSTVDKLNEFFGGLSGGRRV